MSLGGFFKKVTNYARAGANPGGSLIRAARGQPIVGHNSFASVADPLNAVHPSAAATMTPGTQTPFQPQAGGWAAPTMSRQEMVAQAIANHGAQAPQPPMMGAPAPAAPQPPMMGAPAPQMAPRPGVIDPRMMSNVMRAM